MILKQIALFSALFVAPAVLAVIFNNRLLLALPLVAAALEQAYNAGKAS